MANLQALQQAATGGSELASWNPLLEEEVEFCKSEPLGLGNPKVCPNQAQEGAARPKEACFGTVCQLYFGEKLTPSSMRCC